MQIPSPRILYVDDDKDSREMICFMLKMANANYKTIAVGTVENALNSIADQAFDIYIFDYKLPEMTGIELCKLIRETDSRTPILIFSGMARDVDRENASAAGANSYLVKPNDLNIFTATVESLLNENSILTESKLSFGNVNGI